MLGMSILHAGITDPFLGGETPPISRINRVAVSRKRVAARGPQTGALLGVTGTQVRSAGGIDSRLETRHR
jgi:hypothetical protein